jgi:hypothetical protein
MEKAGKERGEENIKLVFANLYLKRYIEEEVTCNDMQDTYQELLKQYVEVYK